MKWLSQGRSALGSTSTNSTGRRRRMVQRAPFSTAASWPSTSILMSEIGRAAPRPRNSTRSSRPAPPGRIAAGTPVIDMDTLIAPLEQIDVHSFLAPDNEFMGASVTQALCDKIGGKGTIIMTQGALGHTGAQGRARGFKSVMEKYPNIEVLDEQPADWDVTKTTRIWDSLLTKHKDISAAYFHNDDMALAAANVMKARGRTDILIGGCDAMPPAIEAVAEGRMFATVRNPSCRIHGGAVMAGVFAVVNGEKTGAGGIPKHVVTDGPVVTKNNAEGMLWMERHFLI